MVYSNQDRDAGRVGDGGSGGDRVRNVIKYSKVSYSNKSSYK